LVDAVGRDPRDPLTKEHDEIRALLIEFLDRFDEFSYYDPEPKKLRAFEPLTAADRPQQALYVAALVRWLVALDKEADDFRSKSADSVNVHLDKGWGHVWGPRQLLGNVLSSLLQRKLPIAEQTICELLAWSTAGRNFGTYVYPLGGLVGAVEGFAGGNDLSDALKNRLEQFLMRLRGNTYDKQCRKYAERLEPLIGKSPEIAIDSGEAWSDVAIADLAPLPRAEIEAWKSLLAHCRSANGAAPSAKWLNESRKLLGIFREGEFSNFVAKWFPLTERKRTQSALTMLQWRARCASEEFSRRYSNLFQQLPESSRSWKILERVKTAMLGSQDPWDYLRNFSDQSEVKTVFGSRAPTFEIAAEPPRFDPIEDSLITEGNMDVLRGLAWTCGSQLDPDVARALTTLAVSSFRKVPGKGPRASRVGNACITALGLMGTRDALGQLALLKVKVKFGGAQAAIEKTLTKLAEKLELPREGLEEMSVPAYGMTEVGKLVQPIGDFTAELTITDSRSTELIWKRSDGKPQKSLPASVKQEHGDDVKELVAAKKDIERMLPAQAERLDSLYLERKTWPIETWRERYIDHPLVGALARRLIWNFSTGDAVVPGLWLKDQIVDRSGNPLRYDSSTAVSLWHPLDQPTDVVLGWRGFLEEWEIVQPFKQAHREVYLLTPAEEQTRVYSNRFAAHLLRQHQFNALCAARGWKNKLRLMVDAEYPPATRWLPQWNLRAEYWIEGAGTEYGTDTLDSGAYRYVSTDQVRFYSLDAAQVSAHAGGGGYGDGYGRVASTEPLALAEIPRLVFSEIMRDVDLFVGVASVGNDPNWLDGGRSEQQRGYWQQCSFGELNASAQTRKAILERLVPRLKIANQCTFADKFLIVQGKRHAYKIHLGSGNILIAPQDKYLCIVPAQAQVDRATEKVFLPFEGDRVLSVILSKAFLLTADDKITDSTILRQL